MSAQEASSLGVRRSRRQGLAMPAPWRSHVPRAMMVASSLWRDTADLRFDRKPVEARFGMLLCFEDFVRRWLGSRCVGAA